MRRLLCTLLSALGCRESAPPPVPREPATLASFTATVAELREEDISKVMGHPNLHTYITLAVAGDAGSPEQAASRHGQLKVNIRSERLAHLYPGRLRVGDRVRVRGTFSPMHSGDVQLEGLELAPP